MENLKEHLLKKVNKRIEEEKEELNDLKERLEVLKADIKVEERLLETEDVPDEIKKDRKGLLKHDKRDKNRKEERIEGTKKELRGLKSKRKVLKGLTEHDLKE